MLGESHWWMVAYSALLPVHHTDWGLRKYSGDMVQVFADGWRGGLGLDKLDAWRNGRHKVETKLEGLPMFEVTT